MLNLSIKAKIIAFRGKKLLEKNRIASKPGDKWISSLKIKKK